MSPAVPRVVVLRALGLGDLLTAVPALRAVRRAFPQHRLQLATPAALEPLVRLACAVDEVVPAEPLGALPRLAHGAEVAVNLHGAGPESHRVLLATRPRRLVALAHPAVAVDGPRDDPRAHERARWCRLLEACGIVADPADLEIEVPGAAPDEAVTVIHPGAASASRRWPVDRWARVAARERAAGRRVLLTGSAVEVPLATALARSAGLPQGSVLAGRTDPRLLVETVARAGLVVSGDTGVAHLAAALRRPSVVLFGPSSPARWGPPPHPWHRALWHGRLGDPHAPTLDPGLARIGVEEVEAAIADVRRAAVTAWG